MTPIWNRLAYERGELLSDEHCPGVLAQRRARRYSGTVGPLNRWVDELRRHTGERNDLRRLGAVARRTLVRLAYAR